MKNSERWYMYGQRFQVLKEFIYTTVKAESQGEWRRQKERTKVKCKISLKATEKCLMRVPEMKIKVVENIFAIICEFIRLYGVEI